jgi:hypothetical protein
MPSRSGTTNSPTPAGTFLYNNNCGSNGNTATSGVFCSASLTTITWGTNTELVFGLRDPLSTWIYTGTDPNRNTPPMPAGVQNFLWHITGTSSYLLGWEDLNSGCSSSLTTDQVSQSTVNNLTALGSLFATCNTLNAGQPARTDNDYNDFYMIITPLTLGTPTEVVPEPMTMTLLATGLVGLGGASLRSRRK